MGKRTAQDLAEQVSEGLSNLEAALIYHFRSNHYPPLPTSCIPVAIKIVKGEVSEDDDVELPEGVTYRGQTTAPVRECIKAWHLSEFMLNPDDWSEQ
jgi:hypothetical protein